MEQAVLINRLDVAYLLQRLRSEGFLFVNSTFRSLPDDVAEETGGEW